MGTRFQETACDAKGERLWKQIKQDKIISGFSARKMILAGKYCLDWEGQCGLKGRYFCGNRGDKIAIGNKKRKKH